MAPTIGTPVCWLTVMANTAASARIAPAMYARMSVSRVDMKILDSPASTILVTNSTGARYDMLSFLPIKKAAIDRGERSPGEWRLCLGVESKGYASGKTRPRLRTRAGANGLRLG